MGLVSPKLKEFGHFLKCVSGVISAPNSPVPFNPIQYSLGEECP